MSARPLSFPRERAVASVLGDAALGGLIEHLHASVERDGLAARILRNRLAYKALGHFSRRRADPVRRLFERAPGAPVWLGSSRLERLQRTYPYQPYKPDRSSWEAKGLHRAGQIQKALPERGNLRRFLDLGCGDGRVAWNLRRFGKSVTAIDIRLGTLGPQVRGSGLHFLRMDAADLAFGDESFDVVYSYDAFEHFADPAAVLQQGIRVLRPGGFLFASFGPLYASPWGAHQWHCIDVPYCHLLFGEDDLSRFAARHGQARIAFEYLNRWTVGQFRELWNRYETRLKLVRYYEKLHVGHLDLIRRYPSCFRSKTDCFDDLIVRSVELLFEKR